MQPHSWSDPERRDEQAPQEASERQLRGPVTTREVRSQNPFPFSEVSRGLLRTGVAA